MNHVAEAAVLARERGRLTPAPHAPTPGMMHAMTPDHETRIFQAEGRLVLTAIRLGRDADGLEAITAMRWRDDAGQTGQDSHVRLALLLERKQGEIVVDVDGELVPVEVEPEDRFLHTKGVDDPSTDPILGLPTY
jgi:hypothetical protein